MQIHYTEDMTNDEKQRVHNALVFIVAALASVGVTPIAPPDFNPYGPVLEMTVYFVKPEGHPFDYANFVTALRRGGTLWGVTFNKLETFSGDGMTRHYLTFRVSDDPKII